MGNAVTADNPQRLTAHALLSCILPESFSGGQWCRGVMDGVPPTEFWVRRQDHEFVKLEANQRYLPVSPAWIATTAQGLGERLFVSPCVYRGYPALTAPTLPGQAIFSKFPISTMKMAGLDRRSPAGAETAYRAALATQPTALVDQGDSVVAIHVFDEPISCEWQAIAAKGLWSCTAAQPWEQMQFTDSRVSDPLQNLVAAIKETMMVALPGQRHPSLVPAFEIKAERVGGLVAWTDFKAQYHLDAIAKNLTERRAEGMKMLASALGRRPYVRPQGKRAPEQEPVDA